MNKNSEILLILLLSVGFLSACPAPQTPSSSATPTLQATSTPDTVIPSATATPIPDTQQTQEPVVSQTPHPVATVTPTPSVSPVSSDVYYGGSGGRNTSNTGTVNIEFNNDKPSGISGPEGSGG